MTVDELLKSLANGIPLEEGRNDPHIFKAVFMAGSPGSGKSTIASRIFSGTGLKELNVDKWWAFFAKHKGERVVDYDKYHQKNAGQMEIFINGRLGLLIDGTAKHPEKIAIVNNRLKALGYETAMIYANTSMETALKRAKSRASRANARDYGRKTDPEFVRDSWVTAQKALGNLQSMFSPRFYIVDNGAVENEASVNFVSKEMNRFINTPVNNHIAKEWLTKSKP